jgi:two-component system, NtrC family, response regulator AtoC
MIGISQEFLDLKEKLLQFAKSNVSVLLTGETGTGKEIAAKFIHQNSNEAEGNFVVVDCTLLSEYLFESELFGHEKGSFTHAVSAKNGLFDLANNGTLFIDEIGELPISQQPKLLRALETREYRRVGGTRTLTSKVRVISATNRQLHDMVKEGRFREDLFYRLSVSPVEIPPLRNRKEDIPLLASYLLAKEGHKLSLTDTALAKLSQHNWPGNVRELKNCLQLAVALASQNVIDTHHIRIVRRRPAKANTESPDIMPANIFRHRHAHSLEAEKNLILQLMVKFRGNRRLIATEMKISERTLYRKLNKHNFNES